MNLRFGNTETVDTRWQSKRIGGFAVDGSKQQKRRRPEFERLLLCRYLQRNVLLVFNKEAPCPPSIVLGVQIALGTPMPEPWTEDPAIAPWCDEGSGTHNGFTRLPTRFFDGTLLFFHFVDILLMVSSEGLTSGGRPEFCWPWSNPSARSNGKGSVMAWIRRCS
jgi:hypothetical protein